ncbi:hypothetical protein E3U55_04490 [Filobacillus milosensis]|uniref:Uncharacterized protein n=1 Tax=Filobacillus milosensis TaxID=94137 RepID=A0A4Y8IR97_9BACI|nr:hypothetical protein [Filobacillus milosensis]TFB24076.1 hypothetical protein E3U55_04490 [Filobacillus milosensis]
MEKIKEISLGKVQKQVPSLELYTEKENHKPFTDGNVYAFINFKDSVNFIGNVSPSYGLDDIEIKTISEEFGDLFLIAGIGTKFTGWATIGYNVGEDKLVQFNTNGKQIMVELNKNNQEKLVGIIKGVHLNPPNLFVFRWANDTLEVSNINESMGFQNGYVALEQSDGKWLLKVGSLSQKNSESYYQYKGEKLIRIE